MCAVKIKTKKIPSTTLALATEFSTAAAGGRLIRSAFFKLLQNADDPRHTGRLMTKMLKVVQSDPIHDWGKRTVADGDLTYLEGFDFSIKRQLHRLVNTSIDTDINRETGICLVHIPKFSPQDQVMIPDNKTHIVFVAAAAEVNFERESFVSTIVKSEYLDIRKPAGITLTVTLPKASKNAILLTVGMNYCHMVNGRAYNMCDREVSSLCIMKVDNAPAIPKNKKTFK